MLRVPLDDLTQTVVEQAMPTRPIFRWHPIAEEVGPDRQDLPVNAFPRHFLPALFEIEQAREERTDRQAVGEVYATASSCGLYQLGAIRRGIALQDRQDFRWDVV